MSPVVSWAGPIERARQALERASDLFEQKKFAAGMDELATMQNNVTLAAEFILRNYPE